MKTCIVISLLVMKIKSSYTIIFYIYNVYFRKWGTDELWYNSQDILICLMIWTDIDIGIDGGFVNNRW